MIDHTKEIIDFLREVDSLGGGHMGMTIPKIAIQVKGEFQDVRKNLGHLFKHGWVTFHDGAQGTMFKLRKTDGKTT